MKGFQKQTLNEYVVYSKYHSNILTSLTKLIKFAKKYETCSNIIFRRGSIIHTAAAPPPVNRINDEEENEMFINQAASIDDKFLIGKVSQVAILLRLKIEFHFVVGLLQKNKLFLSIYQIV